MTQRDKVREVISASWGVFLHWCDHMQRQENTPQPPSCQKLWDRNIMRKFHKSGSTEKATEASSVCLHVCCVRLCMCLCVCHKVMCMWHQIVTSYPQTRWASLHVGPLDITVSSVNWPLTLGHFTLRVNDVFTPLHNKQFTKDKGHGPLCFRLLKKILKLLLFLFVFFNVDLKKNCSIYI